MVRYFTQNTPTHNQPIWSANLEKETLDNNDWRRVLTTTDNLQVVAMNTPSGESLGWEVHKDNDQFFRVESGKAVLSTRQPGKPVSTITLTDGMAAIVPKGMYHNITNNSDKSLCMYTIYGPKHHPVGTIDHTHADERLREQAR